jgi:hypothetical protein
MATANSTNATASVNAKIYVLEKIAATTGTAAAGGTLSAAVYWSGLMVTFNGVQTLITNPIVRVNTTTASTGSGASNSWTMTIPTPANGNTLVAAITLHPSALSPGLTNITQSGATWVRAAYSPNPGGTVTEIWYATNVFNADSTVTFNTTNAFTFRQAAIVAEYSGVNTINPLDVTASSSGVNTTSASTGTTATTSQGNELWFGAIGLTNSTQTLEIPSNGFVIIATANSTNSISANNAKVYALENIVATTGTAASGGTVSVATSWSGVMVALKGFSADAITALNYTMSGSPGAQSLDFSWTGSFKLQSQTNALNVGLNTNWYDYPGGDSSPVSVPVDASNGSVFFRLSK